MSRSAGRTQHVLRRCTVALIGALTLTSCGAGQPPGPVVVSAPGGQHTLNGTDIGDVIARPALVLRETTGRRFALRDRPADELTVLFFGYTRCPDLCPTTMADLAAARRALTPSERSRVQVVFVSEDPTRDTPAVLRGWLARFDRSFVGVMGGNPASAAALAALKAPQTEVAGTPVATASPGTGSSGTLGTAGVPAGKLEHSGSVYAFTRDRVVVYTGGTTPAQYAEDFRALLTS